MIDDPKKDQKSDSEEDQKGGEATYEEQDVDMEDLGETEKMDDED